MRPLAGKLGPGTAYDSWRTLDGGRVVSITSSLQSAPVVDGVPIRVIFPDNDEDHFGPILTGESEN